MGAVIFDMDGVIVDSELHWKAVEAEFLQGLVGRWGDDDQRGIIGMSLYDIHARLVDNYGLTQTREEFVHFYKDLSKVIYGERSGLIPGFSETIQALVGSGTTIGLASSSPHSWIGMVLDRFALRGHFRAVVSSDDVQGRGKPAPDIYLFAADALGVRPRKCVAIEDSSKGIRSAKAAGMCCFGLRNGHNDDQDLSEADGVLEGFDPQSSERIHSALASIAARNENV